MLLRSLIQRLFTFLVVGVLRFLLKVGRLIFRISDEDIAEMEALGVSDDPPPMDGSTILAVPIDQVPLSSLYAVRDVLFDTFVHDVEVASPIHIPEGAYNERRRQYNALRLAKAVEECMKPDTIRAVGVIDGDIYFPGTNFVFAGRVPGTRVVIVGLKRLHPHRWADEEEGKQLMRQRVGAVVVSQISGSFGLGLCENTGCARRFTNSLCDLDEKTARLCSTCAAGIGEWLKSGVEKSESDGQDEEGTH